MSKRLVWTDSEGDHFIVESMFHDEGIHYIVPHKPVVPGWTPQEHKEAKRDYALGLLVILLVFLCDIIFLGNWMLTRPK